MTQPHPHQRELITLMSCIVSWRRAVLEAQVRDGVAEAAVLDGRRALLATYTLAAGGADPFTEDVLLVGVGQMEEEHFLEALFRIEAALSIGWALGLVASLPASTVGADWKSLSALFPPDGAPAAVLRDARLRPSDELQQGLTEWKAITAEARKVRDADPTHETAIPFSRAFERTRALVWVTGQVPWLEDVAMDV
jgi:hypothetical protein